MNRPWNQCNISTGKALYYCSLFDSANSHMCQAEAYSYIYNTEKVLFEKAEGQFDTTLNRTKSKLKDENLKRCKPNIQVLQVANRTIDHSQYFCQN